MTGTYDRQAEGASLTQDNADRLERDPFATVPAAEAEVSAKCGARTAAGTCARAPHGPEYPHYPSTGGHAAQADADMPGAPIPAVTLWSGKWPYSTMGAAQFAGLYRAAAEVIRARGYYAYEMRGYADEPGISVCGALKTAALEAAQAADPEGDQHSHYREATDATEELETRLSAVLYLFGQLHDRTGIRDLSNQLAAWELGYYADTGKHGKAGAVALLEQAAALFDLTGQMNAPVTTAPEPF